MREKINHNIANSLRVLAECMCDLPDRFFANEAQQLDRAFRTCPGITDIDVVWVRWTAIAEPRGWLTDHEMVFNKRKARYEYPENKSGPSQICPECCYSDGRENKDDGTWSCWRCGDEGET